MAEEARTLTVDDFDDVFNALAEETEMPSALTSKDDDLDDEVDETAEDSTEDSAEDSTEDSTEDSAEDGAEDSAEPDVDPETDEIEEGDAEEAPSAQGGDEDADALARLAKLIAETQQQTYERNKASEPKAEAPKQDDEPALYTDDEQVALQEYEKEWPDVARGESLKRRAEYRQLVDYVFNEISNHIAPMMQAVHSLSERTHLQDLQSAVGDYDVVRDDVVNWVDTQPAYLQDAYKRVITNGTVDEVADLITRYKAETGRVQQPQQPAAARPARKKETELPATTKQAAASLAPVSSKRSVVPQGDDPNDFESAFAAFAGKL